MLDLLRTDVESAEVVSHIRQLKTGISPWGLELSSRGFIVRFLVDEMALGFSFLMINLPFIHSHLVPIPEVRDGPDQASHLSHLRSGCTLLFIEMNHITKYTLDNGGGGDYSYQVSQHILIARLKYRVIKKDKLNFIRLYFLNYTWYVNDLHNF